MRYCPACDEEGPWILGPFGFALLDLHRAWHRLGRVILTPFAQLLERITK